MRRKKRVSGTAWDPRWNIFFKVPPLPDDVSAGAGTGVAQDSREETATGSEDEGITAKAQSRGIERTIGHPDDKPPIAGFEETVRARKREHGVESAVPKEDLSLQSGGPDRIFQSGASVADRNLAQTAPSDVATAAQREVEASLRTVPRESLALREEIESLRAEISRLEGQFAKTLSKHRCEEHQRFEERLDRLANAQGHQMFIRCMELSSRAQAEGKTKHAEALLQDALDAYRDLLGDDDHEEVAVILNNLGRIRQQNGKASDAENLYRRALRIKEGLRAPDPYGLATTMNNLATVLRAQGQWDEAESLYTRALSLFQESVGAFHPSTHACRANYDLFRRLWRGPRGGEGPSAALDS